MSENGTRKKSRFVVQALGQTDIGRKREHNEDSIGLLDEHRIYIVADGMGGHAAGEVASRTAIDALISFIRQTKIDRDFTWPFGVSDNRTYAENIIDTGIQIANRKVCDLSESNPQYNGMGTTLAAVYAPDNRVLVAHVGDSRVYRVREGRLQLLTMDHSWVNEQLQRNIITEEEARTHRWRNVITRALGNRTELVVDIQVHTPKPGDLFLICSDGLSGMIDDDKIEMILNETAGDLDNACLTLIAAANEAGGQDNISAVLVRIDAAEGAEDTDDEIDCSEADTVVRKAENAETLPLVSDDEAIEVAGPDDKSDTDKFSLAEIHGELESDKETMANDDADSVSEIKQSEAS